MQVTEIREKITALSDETYRKFHSGLIPGVENIVGVRLPALRSLAKEIARDDWQSWLWDLKTAGIAYYEETMLHGLVICYADMSFDDRLCQIAEFIPHIDNWAVCDSFCSTLKNTKKHLAEMWTFLQPYLHSDKEFEIRFGTVMLLDYFVAEKYIHDVLALLSTISHDGYYVKMAVAWALSVCFIKFPDETLELLKGNQSRDEKTAQLDDFTYHKTIQKICESFRVDKETKLLLRQMKRK